MRTDPWTWVVAAVAVVLGCGGGQRRPIERTTVEHQVVARDAVDAGTSIEPDGPGGFAAGAETVAERADAAAPEAEVDGGPERIVDPEVAWRERIARGRRAFARTCDTCHPGGDEDIGPRIIGKGFSVERMRTQVRRGSGRMRPIRTARLSDDALEDLLAFLTTIRAVRGIGPDVAAEPEAGAHHDDPREPRTR